MRSSPRAAGWEISARLYSSFLFFSIANSTPPSLSPPQTAVTLLSWPPSHPPSVSPPCTHVCFCLCLLFIVHKNLSRCNKVCKHADISFTNYLSVLSNKDEGKDGNYLVGWRLMTCLSSPSRIIPSLLLPSLTASPLLISVLHQYNSVTFDKKSCTRRKIGLSRSLFSPRPPSAVYNLFPGNKLQHEEAQASW